MFKIKAIAVTGVLLCLVALGLGQIAPEQAFVPQTSPPGAPLVEIVRPVEGEVSVGGMYLNAYTYDPDGIVQLHTVLRGPHGFKLEWDHQPIAGYDWGYGCWIGLGYPFEPGEWRMKVTATDATGAKAHDGWVNFIVED